MGGCCGKSDPPQQRRQQRHSTSDNRRSSKRHLPSHQQHGDNNNTPTARAPGRTHSSHRLRVLRVASWNLQCFSLDKANNSSVLGAVCVAILNKRLDLIALQELASPDALEKICDELNSPQLKEVKECKQRKQGEWKFVASTATGRMYQGNEYNGFLWHTSTGVHLLNSGLLGGKPQPGVDHFVRRPFIGYFSSRHWQFVMVTVHLKATNLDMSDLPKLKKEISLILPLVQAIMEQGHDKIIVLGDFNLDACDQSFSRLRGAGFTNLIPVTIPTNISGANPLGSKQYDNLWISEAMQRWTIQGRWGVVRGGLALNNLPISNLESRGGGTVSDHCPVWADFKV